MLALALSLLLGLFQAAQTGTVVGLIKLPNSAPPSQAARPAPLQPAHIILLPPKYTELWNKQVQQRLDNYWEIFKPELAVHKEQITEIYRMVHLEAFRQVSSAMRRELGESAARYMKDASPNGQFEFKGIPFATYQVLAQTNSGGQDMIWSTTMDIDSDVPVFVDLGKPVS